MDEVLILHKLNNCIQFISIGKWQGMNRKGGKKRKTIRKEKWVWGRPGMERKINTAGRRIEGPTDSQRQGKEK